MGALTEDLLHRPSLGQFVDQFVEIAHALHDRVVDLLNAHAMVAPVTNVLEGFILAFEMNVSRFVRFSGIASSGLWVYPVSG